MEDSCNLQYAMEIKKHVRTPVATVGAHCNPAFLEEIIASGQVDVIEMARALMADPDLPKKARMGRDEDIRPCLRCLACFSHLLTNDQIHCAVNPEIGREAENKYSRKVSAPKTVLVVGGGIGGMQAAIEAADKGHKVILCEKSDRLGGALKCEENVPFKAKIKAYIDYQTRKVAESGAEVRLNTFVTPEYADSVNADVIIASLGAVPAKPPIPGMENTLTAEQVYENTEKAGKRVVVMGGGLVGTELAIHLSKCGRDVTIMEMAPMLNSGGNILHQFGLNLEIRQNDIALALGTKVIRITSDGVYGECDGKEVFYPADTVVCAVGQTPKTEEAYALSLCAPEFFVIGDAVTPKNIMQATSMANAAVNDI